MNLLRHCAINNGNGHKLQVLNFCRVLLLRKENVLFVDPFYRTKNSRSANNHIRNYSSNVKHSDNNHHAVEVIRDVRYSSSHPNNILDIYTSTGATATTTAPTMTRKSREIDTIRNDVVLYLHGGLWMKGSKDDSFRFKSNYDLASTLLRYSLYHNYDSPDNRPSNSHSGNTNTKLSNFGLAFASQGITTYVANYRLIGHNQYQHRSNNDDNVTDVNEFGGASTEGQILDVARAIIYVLQQHKSNSQCQEQRPNIYIVGYSAGAHLTALALSQNKYLQIAFQEYCHDLDTFREEFLTLLDSISGFVGISGPYNLSRLDQSPLRDITIGHLKQSMNSGFDLVNKENDDGKDDTIKLLMKSSPLHVILQQWKKYKETAGSPRTECSENFESDHNHNSLFDKNIPLLAQIPVLLLNAENDFHLQTDSEELLVALSQFDSDDKDSHSIEVHTKNNEKATFRKREHFIIQDRNHLNIAWEFGSGFYDDEIFDCTTSTIRDGGDMKNTNSRGDEARTDEEPSLGFFSYFNQASSVFNKVKTLLSSSFYGDTTTKSDDAATKVFHFMDNLNRVRKRL